MSLFLGFFLISVYSFSQSFADSAAFYTYEYHRITEQFGSRVWGIEINTPVIFTDIEQKKAYFSQSTGIEHEVAYKGIYILPLDSSMTKVRPVVDWNAQKWIVVDFPFQYDKKALLEFIAHESFHVHQNRLGIETSSLSLPHLSTIVGRTLMHVEIFELYKALKEENAELKKDHIRNAISLRVMRYEKFAEARKIEKKCEMNEGLAEYTGRKLAGYSSTQLIAEYQNDIRLLETISNEAAYPYTSGSLYAFLNDMTGKDWKSQLPSIDLYQITASLYDIELSEKSKEKTEKLLNEKQYKDIPSAFATVSVEGLKKMFSKNLFIIPTKGSQFQFKSNVVVSIPDHGTVYNNVIVTNEWGRLEVDREGRILISDNLSLSSESLSYTDNRIKGNHWVLILEPQWKVEEKGDVFYLQKKN